MPEYPLRNPETPFMLRIVDFNWEVGGSTVLEIRSDGPVRYTFYRGRSEPVPPERRAEIHSATWRVTRWHQTQLAIERDDIEALRELLVLNFLALDPRYSDDAIADGAQTTLELTVGERVQRVECANSYPEPVRSVLAFVRQRVLAPQQRALNAASEISVDQAREAGAVP